MPSDDVLARLKALKVKEDDLEEKFILGSGKGGQKINKTSSCVFLLHRPSGLLVKCQATRSRTKNRELARLELCRQLEERQEKERLSVQQAKEKQRRINRRPTYSEKEKSIQNKKKRSLVKKHRSRPDHD